MGLNLDLGTGISGRVSQRRSRRYSRHSALRLHALRHNRTRVWGGGPTLGEMTRLSGVSVERPRVFFEAKRWRSHVNHNLEMR